MLRKIIIVSIGLLSFAHADKNMRDMAFSVSDKRMSISGTDKNELKGFDVRFGRVSDFGKIYLNYGNVVSTEYQFRNYAIGLDAYFLDNNLLNLSVGMSVGIGNLKNKQDTKEREILSGNLGVQADIHFSDKFDLFARAGYLKNFEIDSCNQGRDDNICIDSKQLKDLNNFNTRTLMFGFTYRF